MVLGSLVRGPMGVLRRYDIAKGTAGGALALPNLLPGLDLISASVVAVVVVR
jgi:hypothetical protein